VPPIVIEGAPNTLVNTGGDGGGATKICAVDELPPTIETLLVKEPELVPVTFTEMEQGAPNVIDPPESEIWLLPAFAETPPPHPLLITVGGLARRDPTAGNL